MSAVTAKLVTPPARTTTKPRIARGLSLMFKLVDGEMRINAISNSEDTAAGWLLAKPHGQPYVERGQLVIPPRTHSTHVQAALAVFNDPTATVPAPTPEPTVVLEMPLGHATRIRNLVGAQSDKLTGDVFHALRDAGVGS